MNDSPATGEGDELRKRIGYAKLGRSMPLRLENCGSLGGDNEMVPTVKLLAERHPDVDFVLIGRNSGERARDVGLPDNVLNPWIYWAPEVRRRLNERGLNYPNLSIEDHIKVRDILRAVTGDTIQSLDGVVLWLGQHGTSNTPLPSIRDRTKLTKPYDWATLYGSYLLQGINAWRESDPWNREEVLLNADPRNYVKYRDAKWPWRFPVLAQYTHYSHVKHERYGDSRDDMAAAWNAETGVDLAGRPGVWKSRLGSFYARLEISSLLPGTPFGDTIKFDDEHAGRDRFGVVFNETRREVQPAKSRLQALRYWVLPLEPAFIHGKWSPQSQAQLGVTINPIPVTEYVAKLQTVHSTLTTPASGSGWATAKPWEAFAAGVVCFFHPMYDDQNNILGDAPRELRDFLRVSDVKELRRRIDMVHDDAETWLWAVRLQRRHFERAVAEPQYLGLLEERLGL